MYLAQLISNCQLDVSAIFKLWPGVIISIRITHAMGLSACSIASISSMHIIQRDLMFLYHALCSISSLIKKTFILSKVSTLNTARVRVVFNN